MNLYFSFIIPVYNRPDELKELLLSLCAQTFSNTFEVVVIEDGSSLDAETVIKNFNTQLNITYLKKRNTGPGDSRNYGMRHAKGNYFIILDSDCILIPNYLEIVADELSKNYVDGYGGPDGAENSFSLLQKAINYTMTSLWTTGGIRGKETAVGKFQPRSFNMGISKAVFTATGGFGNIHPGEDPDLSFRIWKSGFKTALFSRALVFHKRRISWKSFLNQVFKFGKVRPILNKWHPDTAKITYWFPTVFCLGLLVAIASAIVLQNYFVLFAYIIYTIVLFFDALLQSKNIWVALYSIPTMLIQFVGYGYGFLKSTILLNFNTKKIPEALFPELFFRPHVDDD